MWRRGQKNESLFPQQFPRHATGRLLPSINLGEAAYVYLQVFVPFVGHFSRLQERLSEHRLNTIKQSTVCQNENWVVSIARTRSTKTPCCLLSIESRFPKLGVAG